MGALSPTHWLVIIGVLVVLFGAKRLPDAARSLGRSARILKAEVADLHTDTTHDTAPITTAATTTAATTTATTPGPVPSAPGAPAHDVAANGAGGHERPDR